MWDISKVNNKDTRTTCLDVDVILVSLLLTLNIFHTFSSIFIVDFEQVYVELKKIESCEALL